MLALAAPVVLAELGWVTMGIVDTLMVGRLGAHAIGAVGLASMLFFAVAVFAMGLLLGLDPLVAQAFGAGRLDECHRWLVDGVWLGVVVARADAGPGLPAARHARRLGLAADVLALVRPYLGILTWSLPPLLLYVAFRRYLQAMNLVRPVMIALVDGQRRQRVRQLDPDLRAPRRAGDGRRAARPSPRCWRASSWRLRCSW